MDVAAKVFRDRGYSDASLKEIAERAGMQAGSLYYHFDSKDDLVLTIMERGIAGSREGVERYVDALDDTADAIDRLVAAFTGHLAYLLEEADYAAAFIRMRQQVPPEIRAKLLRKQRGLIRIYAKMFEEARDEGYIDPSHDLSALRQLFIGALNSTPEWFRPRGVPVTVLAEQLGSLMRHGLAHPVN